MTPEGIQQKIFFGYAKAASKLGAMYSVYRSIVPINPIQVGNLIGTQRMSVNVSWTYMTASNYGNSRYNACVDAQSSNSPLSVRAGDYMVPVIDPVSGIIDEGNTYFIQSLQFDLPPIVIQTNRTIGIKRPSQTTGPGYVGYVGHQPSTDITIMTLMPASVLRFRGGEQAKTKLPTDSKEPAWLILIPNLGNIILRTGDVITDDLAQQYMIMDAELSDLGYRITAQQVVNSR